MRLKRAANEFSILPGSSFSVNLAGHSGPPGSRLGASCSSPGSNLVLSPEQQLLLQRQELVNESSKPLQQLS